MHIPMGDVEKLLNELEELGLRPMRTIDKLAQIFEVKLKLLKDIEEKLIAGADKDLKQIRATLEKIDIPED